MEGSRVSPEVCTLLAIVLVVFSHLADTFWYMRPGGVHHRSRDPKASGRKRSSEVETNLSSALLYAGPASCWKHDCGRFVFDTKWGFALAEGQVSSLKWASVGFGCFRSINIGALKNHCQ